MSPIDWATRPLKKYADFKGRAPRAEYWWFYLLTVVTYLIAMIIDSMIGSTVLGPYGLLTLLAVAGLVVPSLAAGARRLHDTNRSGWWLLLPLVPYAIMGVMLARAGADPANPGGLGTAGILALVALVCALVILVFLVMPGTKGPNRFGEDPYAGELAAA